MKNLLMFLLACSLCSAQITLKPNVNTDAKELHHSIENDTLKLHSDKEIQKVTVLSKQSNNSTLVFSKGTNVPLEQLPVGHYTVLVYMIDKVIVFNFEKQ